MSLGTSCACNTACQCQCQNVPCLKPVRDCDTGLYYYYGINSLNQKVKMQLVTVNGFELWKVVQVICQLPTPITTLTSIEHTAVAPLAAADIGQALGLIPATVTPDVKTK